MRYHSLFPDNPAILSHKMNNYFLLTRKMHFGNNNGKFSQKSKPKKKKLHLPLLYLLQSNNESTFTSFFIL